jgi:pyruvate ferredoxin oxidoreductase delta subunit
MPDKEKTLKSKEIMGYQDMPIGGLILDAGNSVKYKTGQWRTKDFYINKDKCSNCMLCFIYCPERCVKVTGYEISKIDLDYCKGCGICAAECPKNAIEMRSK